MPRPRKDEPNRLTANLSARVTPDLKQRFGAEIGCENDRRRRRGEEPTNESRIIAELVTDWTERHESARPLRERATRNHPTISVEAMRQARESLSAHRAADQRAYYTSRIDERELRRREAEYPDLLLEYREEALRRLNLEHGLAESEQSCGLKVSDKVSDSPPPDRAVG